MDEVGAILETGGAAAVELAASALVKPTHCANCGSALTGKFCAVCGQSSDHHRRSVKHLLTDLFKDIASFDSRILRTAYALLMKPGELALAFHEGRTQRYVPPIRLYLFVSLLFFLTLSMTGLALMQFVLKSHAAKLVEANGHSYLATSGGGRTEISKSELKDGKNHFLISGEVELFQREGVAHSKIDPEALSQLTNELEHKAVKSREGKDGFIARTVIGTSLKLAKDPAALNGALTAWMPRVLFLLLPLFALILSAFYWRQRNTLFFVDHLVFSLGFHTFGWLLLLATAALAQLIDGAIAVLVMGGVAAVYLLFAMKRFYAQAWGWTAGKCVAVLAVYFCFCVLPGFAGVIIASVLWG
ncbi:hypothetical protein FHS83_003041 [Rhizomicrobium palustre]|jgi:hypothetical protein|uniref:DUF3667 domain-containing protein n=1 Tax=Rhizomicrobium palustre TaxID=189966 RepID=A0A846N286_9PROT|nr:DUF3667 domain-containing protein [Rhizomicrobium palustre]NIK89723.1 hypothetical protein [Rhizomicrobium palustre]